MVKLCKFAQFSRVERVIDAHPKRVKLETLAEPSLLDPFPHVVVVIPAAIL